MSKTGLLCVPRELTLVVAIFLAAEAFLLRLWGTPEIDFFLPFSRAESTFEW